MEFNLPVPKLPHHALNALFHRGMIRAIARDKLQNNRGKCFGRKLSVWDLHGWEPILSEVLRGECGATLSIVVIVRNRAADLRYTNWTRSELCNAV